MAIILPPGNRYNGHELKSLLQKTQTHLPTTIKAVLANKGYDAGYNYLIIIEELGALSIIPKKGLDTPQLVRQLTLDQYLPLPQTKSVIKEIWILN